MKKICLYLLCIISTSHTIFTAVNLLTEKLTKFNVFHTNLQETLTSYKNQQDKKDRMIDKITETASKELNDLASDFTVNLASKISSIIIDSIDFLIEATKYVTSAESLADIRKDTLNILDIYQKELNKLDIRVQENNADAPHDAIILYSTILGKILKAIKQHTSTDEQKTLLLKNAIAQSKAIPLIFIKGISKPLRPILTREYFEKKFKN